MFALSELFAQFRNLKGRNNVRGPIPESLVNSEEYPAILGLKLLPHDFEGRAGVFQSETLDLRGYLEENKIRDITKLFEDPSYFITYENLRIGLNTIAYLATGDRKFLVPVQTENVPSLLQRMIVSKLKCSYNFGDGETISSDQYFAIHQLVKNAVEFVYRAKRESPTPESFDDNIDVRINEVDTHLVATIKDNGTGILNDKLPLIFGGYTEGGTNVGLRIVKRILDLGRGYAEVVSTRQGQETFKYDTKTKTTSKVEGNVPQGTTFTLYFPKAQ